MREDQGKVRVREEGRQQKDLCCESMSFGEALPKCYVTAVHIYKFQFEKVCSCVTFQRFNVIMQYIGD